MIRVGITGSSGFIARHITEALQQKKGAARIKLFYFDLPDNNILDQKAVKKFVKNKDVLIHAAAVNRGTDAEIIAGSVVGTYNLAVALKGRKNKPKIVFLSSTQAALDSVYGLSKRLAERILEDFSKRNKAPVAVLRLPNVFGEGAKTFYNTVVATFCYQAAHNKDLTIHKNSKNKKLNLIYVKDAARIIFNEVFKKNKNKFVLKEISAANEIKVDALAKVIQSFGLLKNNAPLKSKFYKDLYKTYLFYANG
ncbi:MAG: NAD-dependent epimerase/dehydratase family protein [Candidatus Sungiibacteriota bacterium]